jgi:hypothetical protein
MKNLTSFTKYVLICCSIFHSFSATMWFFLNEGEKSINRADMALVFFALYVILKRVDKNG